MYQIHPLLDHTKVQSFTLLTYSDLNGKSQERPDGTYIWHASLVLLRYLQADLLRVWVVGWKGNRKTAFRAQFSQATRICTAENQLITGQFTRKSMNILKTLGMLWFSADASDLISQNLLRICMAME